MTIKIGSVSVDPGGNRATIVIPTGFDTTQAIRLSNYLGAVAQINNVQSYQQGAEYLHAGTQMVWRSPNVSSPITVTLVPTYPAGATPPTLAQLANSLLVEASDDPENDFTGTYPYPLAFLNNSAVSPVTANIGLMPYPVGAVPVVARASGANAHITATIPAVAGVTAYLTGFTLTGVGSTAGLAAVFNINGILGGAIAYDFSTPINVLQTAYMTQNFTPPLQGGAPNQAIAGDMTALGVGSTSAHIGLYGYYL